ncbi:MAG: restriction endonuclease subunit S [Candidatus Binatia bacterium]
MTEDRNDLFDLPRGWILTTLEDLVLFPKADIVDGPFGSNLKASEYQETGIPIIRLQNIDRNQFSQKNIRFVNREKAEQLKRHGFIGGDIVITKLGDPLGEACIVPDSLTQGIIVADVVRVRVDDRFVSKRLLVFAINSEVVIKQLEKTTKGTTRPRVNLGHIRQLEIPLPPLPEQHRVVAEIEKQFTRLDTAVAALKRTQANLKRYRASVLKAACEGRLVPIEAELARAEGRDYEPADRLLVRILNERRAKWEADQLAKMQAQSKTPKDNKWKEKYQEPVAPDTTDLPELPEGWAWAKAETLSQLEENAICAGPFGTIFKAKDFRPSGVPIIFLRHVGEGRYLTRKPEFMDTAKWEEMFRPYSVFGGELLITKLGEPPGVCAIYPHNIGPAMVTPDVIKMSVNEEGAEPRFLMHYFNSDIARRFISGIAFGTTRLRVTLPIFRDMLVPLPPLPEQHRIVAEVERRLSVIDELESTIDADLKRAERLRQSILKRAFEGKLVPQDPNDEPASVLLERIRAERVGARPGVEARPGVGARRAVPLLRQPEGKKMPKKKGRQTTAARSEARQSLFETLSKSAGRLSPEQLLRQAGYEADDIEEFYEELKREVAAQRIVQERPNNTEVYLRAVA